MWESILFSLVYIVVCGCIGWCLGKLRNKMVRRPPRCLINDDRCHGNWSKPFDVKIERK